MSLVVFLRGVNVGGHKTFRPSQVARKLAKYDVINLGAAGTFVVCRPITEKKLLNELRCCLPFETEAMICPGDDILRLVAQDPFAGEPCGTDIVRFVSVLAKGPRVLPALPLNLPAAQEWLVRIIEVRGRFAIGLYKRKPRTISCFGQIEKHLGGSVTTRNWNTFARLFEILKARKV